MANAVATFSSRFCSLLNGLAVGAASWRGGGVFTCGPLLAEPAGLPTGVAVGASAEHSLATASTRECLGTIGGDPGGVAFMSMPTAEENLVAGYSRLGRVDLSRSRHFSRKD